MDTTNFSAWLPFDNSPTEDLSGNTWTAAGSPTVGTTNAVIGKALQLDGSSYLINTGIAAAIGTTPWTFHWRAACTGSQSDQFFFGTYNANVATSGTGTNYWVSVCYNDGNPKLSLYNNDSTAGTSLVKGQLYHYALSYDGTNLRFFIDGVLKITKAAANIKIGGEFRIGCCAGRNLSGDYFTGAIDEFVIIKGEAWTTNFTPPTANDYYNITHRFETARKVINSLTTWRYENAGDANDLILNAPILTDLPATKSRLSVAFYQTTRAKCFDLPTTAEVWMKFDVYFDGSNRWRAYNGGSNGITGITAQTIPALSYFSNDINVSPDGVNIKNTVVKNQLQAVLLHMISGSSDGIIEAWLDGDFIYRYTGDVNHGQDFADIYLQSDGSGTFFSNVIISNAEIGLNENVNVFLGVEFKPEIYASGFLFGGVEFKPEIYASGFLFGGVEFKPEIYASFISGSAVENISFDTERILPNATAVTFDVERRLCFAENILFDTGRIIFKSSADIVFDAQRILSVNVTTNFDVQRVLRRSAKIAFDTERQVCFVEKILFDVSCTIHTSWLTRILPTSSFLDERFYASAVALDTQISKLFADTWQALHLPRLDELKGTILDLLAEQFHVDAYDAINFSDEEKRELIRQSIAWHRIKGTPGAVKMVLQAVFRDLKLFEWFEYGGEPYYFRLWSRGYTSTPERFQSFWNMFWDAKNVRSHLEKFTIDLSRDEPIKIYTGVARFDGGTKTVDLHRPPPNKSLDIGTGILTFVRGTKYVGMKDWESDFPLEDGNWLRLYFNYPTGRDHPVLLKNPQPELTKGAIRDVGIQAKSNVIFKNQFAEGTLGIDRAALIKGFAVVEKNDEQTLPKDGSLRIFFAFPKGNKHKILLHNRKEEIKLKEIRQLGLSVAKDNLLVNAYNQQTSGVSHVAVVKNFTITADNRGEIIGFEE